MLHKTTSKKLEAIDLTEEVQQTAAKNGWKDGAVVAFVPHCTCALVLNEFEPRICSDYLKLFERLQEEEWAHDQIDNNAAAHLTAVITGSNCVVPLRKGKLVLGTWQKIILLEFDGPRERNVELSFIETK